MTFINPNQVITEVKENHMNQYMTDANFHSSIEVLKREEVDTRIIVNLISMLCDGMNNTQDELAKYMKRYGVLK